MPASGATATSKKVIRFTVLPFNIVGAPLGLLHGHKECTAPWRSAIGRWYWGFASSSANHTRHIVAQSNEKLLVGTFAVMTDARSDEDSETSVPYRQLRAWRSTGDGNPYLSMDQYHCLMA